jgi:putative membrane protein
MIRPEDLPAVNAVLNTTSAGLLVVGWVAVKRRALALHVGAMLGALLASALFLASYLYYHFVVKDGRPTTFAGPAEVRVIYLAILGSHTILAIVVAPMALASAYLGVRALVDALESGAAARPRLLRHARLARWTLPLWLYVSVTGVVVYIMLYLLYPPP